MSDRCEHFDQIRPVTPSANGCEDCMKTGDPWIGLRLCLTCGHVGCCDDSNNTHATTHFHATQHPLIRSLEPGDRWGCATSTRSSSSTPCRARPAASSRS